MTVEEIIRSLEDGNERFMSDTHDSHADPHSVRRGSLTSKQEPYAIILSCADSRVVPEHTFNTGLGELFVVRVAGNVANTSSVASIEYAVAHLGSKVIVVLGHESCGAVTAAVGGGDNGYNLNHLLSHVAPAIASSEDGAPINDIVKENARQNVQELINRSAIVRNAVENGDLRVVPAYYHLDTGKVDFL